MFVLVYSVRGRGCDWRFPPHYSAPPPALKDTALNAGPRVSCVHSRPELGGHGAMLKYVAANAPSVRPQMYVVRLSWHVKVVLCCNPSQYFAAAMRSPTGFWFYQNVAGGYDRSGGGAAGFSGVKTGGRGRSKKTRKYVRGGGVRIRERTRR